MRLILIFLLSLVISCTKDNSLSSEQINIITAQCEVEGGIKEIHVSNKQYLVVCNTDQMNTSKADSASLYDPFILGAELRSCEAYCTKHEGLDRVQVQRQCEGTDHSLFSECPLFKDEITCTCKNKNIKTDAHEIKSEKVGKIFD